MWRKLLTCDLFLSRRGYHGTQSYRRAFAIRSHADSSMSRAVGIGSISDRVSRPQLRHHVVVGFLQVLQALDWIENAAGNRSQFLPFFGGARRSEEHTSELQ